jgi:hypothetical protein
MKVFNGEMDAEIPRHSESGKYNGDAIPGGHFKWEISDSEMGKPALPGIE